MNEQILLKKNHNPLLRQLTPVFVILISFALTALMGLYFSKNIPKVNPHKNPCNYWKPISWSDKDSAETILEIKSNNVAYDAFGCPK